MSADIFQLGEIGGINVIKILLMLAACCQQAEEAGQNAQEPPQNDETSMQALHPNFSHNVIQWYDSPDRRQLVPVCRPDNPRLLICRPASHFSNRP